MVSFSHLAFSIVTSCSLSLSLAYCHLSFSIMARMNTVEWIPSSTGSVLKIYSLSQKSYETLSEYHGSVLALIKANNVNFKRWWSNLWWNCQKVVAALLCILKLSFCCWRFFCFSSLRDLTQTSLWRGMQPYLFAFVMTRAEPRSWSALAINGLVKIIHAQKSWQDISLTSTRTRNEIQHNLTTHWSLHYSVNYILSKL